MLAASTQVTALISPVRASIFSAYELTNSVIGTFPANGKFTDQQREIYQIVLDAQQAAIDAIKPGISFGNLTAVALQTLAQGLLKVRQSSNSISLAQSNAVIRAPG